MRLVIHRVLRAEAVVDSDGIGVLESRIDRGLVVQVGIGVDDGEEQIQWAVSCRRILALSTASLRVSR